MIKKIYSIIIKKNKVDYFLHKIVKIYFQLLPTTMMQSRISRNFIPDSIVYGKEYPYYKTLFKKFTKYNFNNKGDISRYFSLIINIEHLFENEDVDGDLAEVGVWKGNTASILAFYAKKYDRKCYLFDTFEGFDNKDLVSSDKKFEKGHFSDTSIEIVQNVIGVDNVNCCEFIKGYFPDSIPDKILEKKFSVVSLDADLYMPTKSGLEWFYPRMTNKSIFLLHDYSSKAWDGCKKAIDEFCKKENLNLVLMPDKSGSAFIKINK